MATEIGDAHEKYAKSDRIDDIIAITDTFPTLEIADSVVDQLNNKIGRNISTTNELTTKINAERVLDIFYQDGLS